MDKRVERTKGTIRRTLLSLMGERPVERITTTELCREAHINRNTFYAHYGSPEDVLREVEDELVASIGQELRKGYEEGGVTLAMTRHVARHQELYRALWRCKSSRLKERAMDLVIGRILGVWHESSRMIRDVSTPLSRRIPSIRFPVTPLSRRPK